MTEQSRQFFDLSNQTALVTGAATGIGMAIATRLALAGATVAVADIKMDAAEKAAEAISNASGARAFPVRMDVTIRDSVERAIETTTGRTGRLDVLVNNAGIAGRAAPLWEQTDDDWSSVVAINLNGVFFCSRAVIQRMRTQQYKQS